MVAVQPPVVKALRHFYWIVSVLVLGACSSLANPEHSQWEFYQNERYDFAFPYPDTWTPGPIPDNLDGRVFRDSRLDGVSIRGWASQFSENRLAPDGSPPDHNLLPNFTTEQGLEGRLNISIGEDTSSMQLTLMQDGVMYYWEGRSPSDLFDDYFKFFYYVAEQYRLEEVEGGS